jgi:hypothetical protein
MRWNVDLSSIGSEQPPQRYCVEAEQWQKALQRVRSLRGDEGTLGSFSIELLDDGYRAIDPLTRTRFVVTRAADDAALSEQPKVVPEEAPAAKLGGARSAGGEPDNANGAPPARASNRGARPSERGRNRRNAAMGGPTIPTDPVPRPNSSTPAQGASPSLTPVTPLVPSRPMQAETAFERMTGGSAVPLPTEVTSRADAPTQILGEFKIVARRNEDPTPSSPLTYREVGIVVPPTTSLADAEAIARAQLTIVQNAIGGAPKGRYVQLAIFDYEYSGKPSKGPPILTLTFKDWRGDAPDVRFPKRDGVTAGPSSLPPRSLPPSTAAVSMTPSTTRSQESSLIAEQMMSVDSIASDPSRTTKPTMTQPGDAFADTTVVIPREEIQTEVAPATKADAIRPSPVVDVGSPDPPLDRTAAASTLASAAPAVPAPTPSELRRGAADMAGDDDLTMVKDSRPPPESPEVVEIVIPVASALPRASTPPPAAPIRTPSVPPPATPSVPPPATPSVPPQAAPSVPPPAAPSVPPPAAPSVPPPQPAQPTSPSQKPSSRTLADGTAKWADLVKESAPPPSRLPPAGLIVRAPKPTRKGGDELISDLFEACSDLAFVHDPLEAAEFVADLVLESIPSLAVLVSFFDINTREFVVVRQAVTNGPGEDLPNVVLTRASEFTPSIARTMRGGRSVVATGAECSVVTTDARWSALGVVPDAMISAPVEFGGRFLGLIELCNPLDGGPLSESDGHALTYVGEQFAEYLAQREISVDPDYVRRPKLAQLARR